MGVAKFSGLASLSVPGKTTIAFTKLLIYPEVTSLDISRAGDEAGVSGAL